MLHSTGLAATDIMQSSTPAPPIAGGTVAITNTGMNGLTVVNPAGVLATLTVNLPADSVSKIGQIERIAFLKAITLLTLGVTGGGSILNAITSAALNDNVGYQKVAANTWIKMG